MYDPTRSYEENFADGPFPTWNFPSRKFPRLRFSGEPAFRFLGQSVSLPFGVPAGPLLNSRFVRTAWDAGCAVATYKTVRSRSVASHPFPNVTQIQTSDGSGQLHGSEEPPQVVAKMFPPIEALDHVSREVSISNSFGVPSQAPEFWIRDVEELRNAPLGCALVLSFQGTRDQSSDAFLADTVKTMQLAEEAQSRRAVSGSPASSLLLEVNLSCPNEKGQPVYQNVVESKKILAALHAARRPQTKMIVKVGVLSDEACLRFVDGVAPHVHAISSINTVYSEIRAADGGVILGSKQAYGGVCGDLIYSENLLMLRRLVAARKALGLSEKELEIISVGGINRVERVLQALEMGASSVQAATACMWDLSLPQEVARALGVQFETI